MFHVHLKIVCNLLMVYNIVVVYKLDQCETRCQWQEEN